MREDIRVGSSKKPQEFRYLMWNIHNVWPAGLLYIISGIILHLTYTKIAPYLILEFPDPSFTLNMLLVRIQLLNERNWPRWLWTLWFRIIIWMSDLDSHAITFKPLADCGKWNNEDNHKYMTCLETILYFLASLYIIRRLSIKDQFDQLQVIKWKWKWTQSVTSDSLRPHGL